MRLDHVLTIALKEMREIATNRGLLFSGIFFGLWFGLMGAMGVGGADPVAIASGMDNALFYMVALIALFTGYLYSSQTYLREKQSGIVETLLCTPASLRSIWIGKAIGVSIPSHITALVGAALITTVANYRSPVTLVPSAPVLVHLVLVVPIFTVAAVGLMGFGQLMLGMRENMAVNMATIMVLVGGLLGARLIVDKQSFVSWLAVGTLAGASLVLLSAVTWLGRFLSRERIVTTIS